jgi:inosine/xanthosine triphosphatase
MKIIQVAVGSTRLPKLNAVREALALLGPKLEGEGQFEIEGVDVASGVGHTPLTREETMAGARQRAEALVRMPQPAISHWQYFVGLEGGIDVVRGNSKRLVFLENWAYVSDATGYGGFGQSGAVLLPEKLAQRVVDEGVDLSEAIDAFAGGRGIRDAQGAWGVLTSGIITRQDAFRIATVNAFAPFLNREFYERR